MVVALQDLADVCRHSTRVLQLAASGVNDVGLGGVLRGFACEQSAFARQQELLRRRFGENPAPDKQEKGPMHLRWTDDAALVAWAEHSLALVGISSIGR